MIRNPRVPPLTAQRLMPALLYIGAITDVPVTGNTGLLTA